jgi:predicted amidohydrolase
MKLKEALLGRKLDEVEGIPDPRGKFIIKERKYSDDDRLPSIGLANIHAEVPNIEANKRRILEACRLFKSHGANVCIFPEFCFTGYFWEDQEACWPYMEQGTTDVLAPWINANLRPLLDNNFKAIIFNNIRKGPDRKFLNSTFVLSHQTGNWQDPAVVYDKIFLPGIEKTYTETGQDDRLTVDSVFGQLGFTTCYDILFTQLSQEYTQADKVDAIVEMASWRAMATREYPGMNVWSDEYYGDLWDMTMPAIASTNQVWVIAVNAVGIHGISKARFWGGSGLWAPSGLKLIQASKIQEELLIVHNIDIKGERQDEQDDFNYTFDFNLIYRPIQGQRAFTRI